MMFAIHGLIEQVTLNFIFYIFLLFDIESEVGVQRDCISTDTPEYKTMKQMIRNRNDGCVKRLNGLDCFTFCSDDKCN
jgi:hypothetical protein